jgi:Holliday junction resolvase RusA-like endonuclease
MAPLQNDLARLYYDVCKLLKKARSMTVKYLLPWPPSANHAHGRSGRRIYLSQRTKQYREDVRAAIWADRGVPHTVTALLGVSLIFEPPQRYSGDLDNLIKQTLDALQAAGVMADDKQVVVIRAEKGQRRKEGRVRVVMWIEREGEYGSW